MNHAFSQAKTEVIVLVLLTAVLAWIYPVLGLIPLALLAFLLYFYRDPQRQVRENPGLILAPADGTVTRVTTVPCEYVGQGSWQVSIFMSPLNVHVNRSPIAGAVESLSHHPGRYLPAMNPEAPMVNEKRIYLIKGKIRVKVVQVAGIMARRTVSWVKEGQELAQGDKIGLIKLGSCTQVTFPSGYKVSVTEGDKVQGGLTIIGEES